MSDSSNSHAPAPTPTPQNLTTATPSLASTTTTAADRERDFAQFAHYAALSCLVAVPVLIVLPPRKLDFYTFTLVGCGVISGNHLIRERYNVGMLGLVGEKMGLAHRIPREQAIATGGVAVADEGARMAGSLVERFDLPTEKSRRVHGEILAAEEALALRREGSGYLTKRAEELRERGWGYGADMKRMLEVARVSRREDEEGELLVPSAGQAQTREGEVLQSAVATTAGSDHEGERAGFKGMVKNVWYGSEDANHWKEQRMKEEREALEEGRGYADMIMEQIWEVWNWDKRKDEDGEWVTKEQYKDKYEK